MKRTVLISVLLLLLAVLCACAAPPTMDLSGFLQNRRSLGAPPDLTRLYRTESADGQQFFLPLGETLSLRLLALETGELYECRVLLQKMTGAGALLPAAAQQEAFGRECALTLQAFCGVPAREAAALLRALSVFDPASLQSAGACTTAAGPFALCLQSHPLELAFSVRDTRLRDLPAARMPESRPLFGETAATRSETVPHK